MKIMTRIILMLLADTVDDVLGDDEAYWRWMMLVMTAMMAMTTLREWR